MRKGVEGPNSVCVVYCAVFGLYVSDRCVVGGGGHQTFANFCDLFTYSTITCGMKLDEASMKSGIGE